ncbi:MAG: hypothetical protein R3B71_05200 [Candidatus Gracilibacteria bacterium]|nr:hypothetical protein [Candidatus Peregrinibacteria bacterium]
MKKFFAESRLIFKNKPSSAPQEAPSQDIEAGKETWKTLEELESSVIPVVNALQKRFDDISQQYKVTISGTEFEGEYEQSYIKAGMPQSLRDAIKKGVETFNTIMDAIDQVKAQQEAVKSKLSQKVKAFNEEYKAAVTSSDPLDDKLLTNYGDIEFNPNAAPAPEPKQEEVTPEVKEATTDQKVQSSIEAMLRQEDDLVDAEALIKKCGGKQLEIKKEKGDALYTREMAKNNLIRAVITPSTDGQSVRIEWWITGKGHQNVEGIRQEIVFNKDPERKDMAKFPASSEGEKSQENLDKNRDQFRKDVEWLKAAPVGSKIDLGNGISVFKDPDGKLYMKGKSEKDQPIPYEEEGSTEEGVLTGTIVLVNSDTKPERVSASAAESKEFAQKKINKIAKDLIMASSAPQVGDMPKIIQGMAEDIAKLAKANNITSVRMEGTGATGQKHFVEIGDNKVAWGPVEKKGDDAKVDTGVRYAQGEVKIDSATA